MSDCPFCRIVAGEIPSTKVFEDDRIYAFEDILPQAPTHVLVVPRKHFVNLHDAAEDPGLLGEIVARCAAIAREKGTPEFRLVTNSGIKGGQAVFHLHFHVLGGRQMHWPPG
ncbi:MAG: histidine triad nucleotide-binding protein [Acidobacteriota bacterium]|nr:histidine triad nucleotide-binding protein [Acidobacteriota bacterium]